jgi:diguanylate cyclase (GGDEF)-like protein
MATLADRRRRNRESVYADIQVDLTRLMFEGLLGTVVLGTVGMVGCTAVVAAWYHDDWLWHLTAVMCLLCGLRVGVVLAFLSRRDRELTVRGAQAWELIYGLSLLLMCLSLVASTVYNFDSRVGHERAAYWCTAGVFSVASGINARIALRPWIGNSTGLMLLAALAYSLLRSPEPLTRLTAVLLGIFALTHCAANRTKFAVLVDQIRARRKLLDLSERDALTGLANRRRFQALLDQATDGSYAVLYLDLDRFKAVNDTFGHATGDALLKAVAERLHQVVRAGDALARLGGDEFAILHYPGATEATTQALAARITESIARPYTIGDDTMSVGVSVGICLQDGTDFDTESAMKLADKALYAVKQAGGGTFTTAF